VLGALPATGRRGPAEGALKLLAIDRALGGAERERMVVREELLRAGATPVRSGRDDARPAGSTSSSASALRSTSTSCSARQAAGQAVDHIPGRPARLGKTSMAGMWRPRWRSASGSPAARRWSGRATWPPSSTNLDEGDVSSSTRSTASPGVEEVLYRMETSASTS